MLPALPSMSIPAFASAVFPSATPTPSVPSVPPSAPAIGGCVPGQGGVPDSVLGEVMCGTWADDVAGAWHAAWDRWPLLLAAVAALLGVRLGWAAWRRRVWRLHAAQAQWLEITPPATATPAATLGLWRLIATLLPAPRRWGLRPARLVWEVVADPGGMRVGLWLPPEINPTAVRRLLQRGWPGVRADQTTPPRTPTGQVAALRLVSTQPEWLPLVTDATPSARRGVGRGVDAGAPEDDRLRAVYDGLASAGRTGGGLLQVHISRAPARRLRVLRRAMTNPARARRPRTGAAFAADLLTSAVRAGILVVLDLLTPGPPSPSTSSVTSGKTTTDPYTTELARQARAKFADAPHLLVAVYAIATGPTKAAARSAAADITSGFGLLSAHFDHRRLALRASRGAAAAAERWTPLNRMSLASIAEAAALAGLPAEPAAYGLPGAASRRRVPTRDIFRTDRTSGREVEPRRARRASEQPNTPPNTRPSTWPSTRASTRPVTRARPAADRGGPDEPTMWSTP